MGRVDDLFYEGTCESKKAYSHHTAPQIIGWGKITFYNEQPARKRISLALHAPVANVMSTRIWSAESFFATLTILGGTIAATASFNGIFCSRNCLAMALSCSTSACGTKPRLQGTNPFLAASCRNRFWRTAFFCFPVGVPLLFQAVIGSRPKALSCTSLTSCSVAAVISWSFVIFDSLDRYL